MNKDKLRKSLHHRVKLQPVAKRFIGSIALDPIDDDWLVDKINDTGVTIKNIRTGHIAILGFDHIHHYTSDPNRGNDVKDGLKYGFFTLTVQVHIDQSRLWITPVPLQR